MKQAIKESLQVDSIKPPAAPSPIKPPVASHPPNHSIPSPSPLPPTPTGPQAIGAACLQNIEVCSNPELIQRAFIMQQKLKKLADDWQVEEKASKSWAQKMEARHRRLPGNSTPLQPLPPDATPQEKAEYNRRQGFEVWIQQEQIDIYTRNKKRYNDQFRTDALQIRDEITNRYPQARALSGYEEYTEVGSYQQVYAVVDHLGNCMDALRNTP